MYGWNVCSRLYEGIGRGSKDRKRRKPKEREDEWRLLCSEREGGGKRLTSEISHNVRRGREAKMKMR